MRTGTHDLSLLPGLDGAVHGMLARLVLVLLALVVGAVALVLGLAELLRRARPAGDEGVVRFVRRQHAPGFALDWKRAQGGGTSQPSRCAGRRER